MRFKKTALSHPGKGLYNYQFKGVKHPFLLKRPTGGGDKFYTATYKRAILQKFVTLYNYFSSFYPPLQTPLANGSLRPAANFAASTN